MTGANSIPNFAGVANAAFDPVIDAFADNFSQGLESGAAFCVIVGDEIVVDVCGGFANEKEEKPWADETLACVYSTGKATLAFFVARAVANGKLDYEAPVAAYWPEFAGNGKAEITLAQLMSHQAGLSALSADTQPAAWIDWSAITSQLEAMAPLWAPGSASGYHPQTIGFLAGELLRRVEGKSVGELLREEGVDVYCGLQPAEMARAARMRKPPAAPDLGEITELKRLSFLAKSSTPGRVAPEDWMAAEIPASNMHANAHGLARLLHPFSNDGRALDGEEVLSAAAIEGAFRERIRGRDLILPFELSWGAGLMRNINRHFGPNENAFGHAGFGGSCVLIDPGAKLTAVYVMNKMSPHLVGDPRPVKLIDAAYNCL